MPDNAFDPEFLTAVAERDAPTSSEEADFSGPWEVRPWKEGWGVFAAGVDRPRAIFVEHETALLAAALYPADGRDSLYLLGGESEEQGFPVQAVRGEDAATARMWSTPASTWKSTVPAASCSPSRSRCTRRRWTG